MRRIPHSELRNRIRKSLVRTNWKSSANFKWMQFVVESVLQFAKRESISTQSGKKCLGTKPSITPNIACREPENDQTALSHHLLAHTGCTPHIHRHSDHVTAGWRVSMHAVAFSTNHVVSVSETCKHAKKRNRVDNGASHRTWYVQVAITISIRLHCTHLLSSRVP